MMSSGVGTSYLLVWTTQSLFLGTYVGQVGQVWRFDKVGDKCGLIGPNAAAVLGSTAFWISPDRQFHSYSAGGAVAPVACPILADFARNLAASQNGLGILLSEIGASAESRMAHEAALAIRQRLANAHPTVTKYQSDLAATRSGWQVDES